MSEWNKTSCVLCAQNCGLEIRVENNRMVQVRPDKDNPRSEGYAWSPRWPIGSDLSNRNPRRRPWKGIGPGPLS